jgi:SAM-dependent methyltransferase
MEPNYNYLSVVYNETTRPFTEYPDLLASYLVSRYSLTSDHKLLEVGCGRGDFLRGFIRSGIQCYGVDQSDIAKNICPEAEITLADLEKEIPYEDNCFDVVYSKSVIEHFYYPDHLFSEIYRVLKPGGLAIFLTPDWKYNYKNFYDDYTHRVPFTLYSLRDIMLITSFENVQAERFRQLPFLWKMPWLKFLSVFTAWIAPSCLKENSKFIRFSKEVMLLGSCIKPKS